MGLATIYAAVDAGNGFTNAVVGKLKGQVKKTSFPSVRANAPVGILGAGSEREHSYTIVKWLGHKYTYGAETVRMSALALERHHGRDRYGNEFHAMLVALALVRTGVKSGADVDLTIFLPPGMFASLDHDPIKISFQTGLAIEIDGKFFEWNIVKVSIQPEGLAAVAAFTLTVTGKMISTSIFDNDVVILDSGTYTLDSLLLRGGQFDPASLEAATWDGDGLYRHIILPLSAQVKAFGDTDFLNISSDMIDKAVYDSHYSGGRCFIESAGKTLTLTDSLNSLAKKYAAFISNNIVDNHYRGFMGIEHVIIVGGGSHLITRYLKEWYPEKILDYAGLKNMKNVKAVELNAVGGQRWSRYVASMTKISA